jgi:prepilin-type N-terminal cleavage/methylation domain-containing protein
MQTRRSRIYECNTMRLNVRGHRCSRGFTLTELAVVIVIFAILVGVLMFSTGRAKSAVALQNATMLVMTDLRRQRQRSVTTEGKCGIRIVAEGYVCYEGDSMSGVKGGTVDLSRLLGITIKIAQPPIGSVIEFNPQIPAAGAWASLQSTPSTIVLECGDNRRSISVSSDGAVSLN